MLRERHTGTTELQSEAAKAKYTPKPGERNAGTKSVDVVSMFGPVGTISRTYYYDKASRRGHYPWDEQMGLVGRTGKKSL